MKDARKMVNVLVESRKSGHKFGMWAEGAILSIFESLSFVLRSKHITNQRMQKAQVPKAIYDIKRNISS